MSNKKSVGSIAPLALTTITNEHLLNLDVLCQTFETNLVRGLKSCQVKRALKENGKNKFTRPKNMFTMDFGGLLERNSSKREKFSRTEWKRIFGQQLPNEVTVVRDGVRKGVVAKYIVVGDVVELETNDVVPADIRLIWANNVVVDNRLITGNSYESRSHLLDEANDDPLLSPNMIYACTRIISGDCIGVALKTGEDTVFGTLKYFATKVKIEKRRYASRSGSVNSSSNSESGSTSSVRDSDSRRDSDISSTISNMYIDVSEQTERRLSDTYTTKCRSVSDCYANLPTDYNNSTKPATSVSKTDSTDSVFY